MLGFSEVDRVTVDDAVWDSGTMTVKSPLAPRSNYAKDTIANMEKRGFKLEDLDLSLVLANKDKIDTDLETAEKDRLMRANNIPEDDVLQPIGASGAEVRSDASGVSSMAQSQRSTATINLENSYKACVACKPFVLGADVLYAQGHHFLRISY